MARDLCRRHLDRLSARGSGPALILIGGWLDDGSEKAPLAHDT